MGKLAADERAAGKAPTDSGLAQNYDNTTQLGVASKPLQETAETAEQVEEERRRLGTWPDNKNGPHVEPIQAQLSRLSDEGKLKSFPERRESVDRPKVGSG